MRKEQKVVAKDKMTDLCYQQEMRRDRLLR